MFDSGAEYTQDRVDFSAFGGSRYSVVEFGRKVGKAIGYLWFMGAAMTWMLCPSPSPLHVSSPAKYADEAGYFAECLSLWPAVAYFTLES